MLSWRGAVAGADAGRFLMLLLLDDVRIAPGASSETAFDQQMMKVDQRRHCYARRADRHACAGDGVQHLCGDRRDHARHRLDVNKPTGYALLAVMPPDTAPEKRVPAVMDLNFLPDMGRMTG